MGQLLIPSKKARWCFLFTAGSLSCTYQRNSRV